MSSTAYGSVTEWGAGTGRALMTDAIQALAPLPLETQRKLLADTALDSYLRVSPHMIAPLLRGIALQTDEALLKEGEEIARIVADALKAAFN
ncbi:hypothetical protein AB0F17_34195 [Nonomuraea sp. NPDC026600]|uniref:hypothetical protein n=1 Tax=Nonomuraea sp. NPDC026600 TaxID=3155363 RepID=UPI0033EF0392